MIVVIADYLLGSVLHAYNFFCNCHGLKSKLYNNKEIFENIMITDELEGIRPVAICDIV